MPSEDVRKTANWDSLFDTYKVKIAALIYNIYNRIIQRKESKYDLRHQHRVSIQRFETYYMKNSISYRAKDYAKRAKKSHALRILNFNEESPQISRPQIDSDFVFY